MKMKFLSLFVAFSVVIASDVLAGSIEDQSALSIAVAFDRSGFDVWQDCELTVTLTNVGTTSVSLPTSPNIVTPDIDAAPKQLALALVISGDEGLRHQVHALKFYGSPQISGSLVTVAPGEHVTLQTPAKWGLQPEFAAAFLSQASRSFNARVEVSESSDGTSWSPAVSSAPQAIELKLPQ